MLEVGLLHWKSYRGLAILVAVVISLLAIGYIRRDRTYVRALRSRFLHGVPWGTFITMSFVLAVYLFVQGVWAHPGDPLVLPFRSWSYYYPLGMLTAAFSHASRSHLVGNLVGTIAYASVAEYAWGHYPRKRGTETFTSALTNPYVRILAVPVTSIAVGLLTASFAIGAIVGFSGVVFAYAGFALIQRPLLTTLAILGSQIVDLVLEGILNPRSVAIPRPGIIMPWWTDIAIQGHAIGLLTGLLLGIWLARSRDDWTDPRHLWFGLMALVAFHGLWAVYVPADGGRFILFRWAGIVAVALVAPVIVTGAARLSRPSLPKLDVSRRSVAVGVMVVLLVTLSIPAVFYNLAPVAQQADPEPAVHVRGYTITYAENVENEYIGSVTLPFVNITQSISTSGVIVMNERRYIWHRIVPAPSLKQSGFASFLVGGLQWRKRIFVDLRGWTLAGGHSVYNVFVRPDGRERTLVFSADPARAAPILTGKRIFMRSVGTEFEFVVTQHDEIVGTAPVPDPENVTRAGGITFIRTTRKVYAVANRTRILIAKRIVER